MSEFNSIRESLHISMSQVKTFLLCPRQYELKYIRGLDPAFKPSPLAFGTAIHKALAAFYERIQSTGISLEHDEFLENFIESWASQVQGNPPLKRADDEEPGDLLEKGIGMLAHFYREMHAKKIEVAGVEIPFAIGITDIKSGEEFEEQLIGTIDLILQEKDRKVIVEHKTSAKKWSANQLKFDQQITAYQKAAKVMGMGDAGLRFQILTKTKGCRSSKSMKYTSNY